MFGATVSILSVLAVCIPYIIMLRRLSESQDRLRAVSGSLENSLKHNETVRSGAKEMIEKTRYYQSEIQRVVDRNAVLVAECAGMKMSRDALKSEVDEYIYALGAKDEKIEELKKGVGDRDARIEELTKKFDVMNHAITKSLLELTHANQVANKDPSDIKGDDAGVDVACQDETQ